MLGKRSEDAVSIDNKSSETNWRRRIYDALNVLQNSGAVEMDEKEISLPVDKSNMCGLVIAREELFTDMFIKKRNLANRRELLTERAKEYALLVGLLERRKVQPPEDLLPAPSLKEPAMYVSNPIKIEEGGAQEVAGLSTQIPQEFKIPFFLVAPKNNQKVTLFELSFL